MIISRVLSEFGCAKDKLIHATILLAALTLVVGALAPRQAKAAPQKNLQLHFNPHWLIDWIIPEDKQAKYRFTENGIPLSNWQDITLPECQVVNIPMPTNATDYNVTDYFTVDPDICETKAAAFQPGGPGVVMQNLTDFLDGVSRVASTHPQLAWVDIQNQEVFDLYVGIDLAVFYSQTGFSYTYDPTAEYQVVDGACSALPGYLFGSSEITFDPTIGWTTANPLGTVADPATVVPVEDTQFCIPEPSGLVVWCMLGAVGIAVRSWRRRRKASFALSNNESGSRCVV